MDEKQIIETKGGQGEVIIYQAQDGVTKIDVRFVDENVWLSIDQLVFFDRRHCHGRAEITAKDVYPLF